MRIAGTGATVGPEFGVGSLTTTDRTVDLFLLRHAHAGSRTEWSGSDAARPLSARGRRQAERLGRHLSGLGLKPGAIISSPKARASETADLVAKALGAAVRIDERLAGPLDLGDLEAILHEAGDPAQVLVVGHDPDFSALAGELCGDADLHLAKGALARIEALRPLHAGGGQLRWLIAPDALEREA